MAWYIVDNKVNISVKAKRKKGETAEKNVTTTVILFQPLAQDPEIESGSFCFVPSAR